MTEDELHAAYPDLFQKWFDKGYAAAKETFTSKERKDELKKEHQSHVDCSISRHWRTNFEELRKLYHELLKEKKQNWQARPYKKKYPKMGYHRPLKKKVGFCVYCGAKSNTFDHLIPKSRGGSDKPENMAEACYGCNNEKGNMTYKEYMTWRKFHKPV